MLRRSACRSTKFVWKPGRKIVTKETQEGCLSFSIISFPELFEVQENLLRLTKKFFRQPDLRSYAAEVFL